MGLRVLHRTQVKGSVYPARQYEAPMTPPMPAGGGSKWQKSPNSLYWWRNLELGIEIGGVSLLDNLSAELIYDIEKQIIR